MESATIGSVPRRENNVGGKPPPQSMETIILLTTTNENAMMKMKMARELRFCCDPLCSGILISTSHRGTLCNTGPKNISKTFARETNPDILNCTIQTSAYYRQITFEKFI